MCERERERVGFSEKEHLGQAESQHMYDRRLRLFSVNISCMLYQTDSWKGPDDADLKSNVCNEWKEGVVTYWTSAAVSRTGEGKCGH